MAKKGPDDAVGEGGEVFAPLGSASVGDDQGVVLIRGRNCSLRPSLPRTSGRSLRAAPRARP